MGTVAEDEPDSQISRRAARGHDSDCGGREPYGSGDGDRRWQEFIAHVIGVGGVFLPLNQSRS